MNTLRLEYPVGQLHFFDWRVVDYHAANRGQPDRLQSVPPLVHRDFLLVAPERIVDRPAALVARNR
jgi:hypothetical protein